MQGCWRTKKTRKRPVLQAQPLQDPPAIELLILLDPGPGKEHSLTQVLVTCLHHSHQGIAAPRPPSLVGKGSSLKEDYEWWWLLGCSISSLSFLLLVLPLPGVKTRQHHSVALMVRESTPASNHGIHSFPDSRQGAGLLHGFGCKEFPWCSHPRDSIA